MSPVIFVVNAAGTVSLPLAAIAYATLYLPVIRTVADALRDTRSELAPGTGAEAVAEMAYRAAVVEGLLLSVTVTRSSEPVETPRAIALFEPGQ